VAMSPVVAQKRRAARRCFQKRSEQVACTGSWLPPSPESAAGQPQCKHREASTTGVHSLLNSHARIPDISGRHVATRRRRDCTAPIAAAHLSPSRSAWRQKRSPASPATRPPGPPSPSLGICEERRCTPPAWWAVSVKSIAITMNSGLDSAIRPPAIPASGKILRRQCTI